MRKIWETASSQFALHLISQLSRRTDEIFKEIYHHMYIQIPQPLPSPPRNHLPKQRCACKDDSSPTAGCSALGGASSLPSHSDCSSLRDQAVEHRQERSCPGLRAGSLGTGQALRTNGEELTSNSIYSHSFISMLFSPLIMVTTIMIAAFNTCHAPAPHSLFVLYFPRCFLNGPYGGNWAGTVVGFFEGLLKQCAKTETARPAESDCFLETCLTLAVFDTGLHGSWHPWQTGAVWLNLQVMQVAAAAVELNLRTMASLVQIEQHTAVLLNWIWLRMHQYYKSNELMSIFIWTITDKCQI